LYGLRGYRKQEKYDIEGALADYREALRLNPNTAWVYNSRGVLYRDAGDYDTLSPTSTRRSRSRNGPILTRAAAGFIAARQG
jgi:tetratricopeptide (TPR) repeat protein